MSCVGKQVMDLTLSDDDEVGKKGELLSPATGAKRMRGDECLKEIAKLVSYRIQRDAEVKNRITYKWFKGESSLPTHRLKDENWEKLSLSFPELQMAHQLVLLEQKSYLTKHLPSHMNLEWHRYSRAVVCFVCGGFPVEIKKLLLTFLSPEEVNGSPKSAPNKQIIDLT